MSYYSFLVPLLGTVGLLIICFLFYVLFGKKCCNSYHQQSSMKTFNTETLIDKPEEINFTCEQ